MVIVKLKDLLKKYRTDHALTQEELAQRIGINRCLYSQIENGKRNIGSKTKQKIAKLLNIAPEYIVEMLNNN